MYDPSINGKSLKVSPELLKDFEKILDAFAVFDDMVARLYWNGVVVPFLNVLQLFGQQSGILFSFFFLIEVQRYRAQTDCKYSVWYLLYIKLSQFVQLNSLFLDCFSSSKPFSPFHPWDQWWLSLTFSLQQLVVIYIFITRILLKKV